MILLTGGLGYIGSNLYDRLSNHDEVVILDNKNDQNSKIKNTIKGDVRDKKIVYQIMKDIEIIIHMAAQINVAKSIENPVYDATNNIYGTLNLLEAARKSHIEQFIYISSAAVYGIPKYLPIDEEHGVNPISPYGLSKLTGERYTMLYHDLYNLPVTCLRLFNVFGPKQINNSYSGVMTKFIENVNNNISPIIFGDGNQIRDFVYINDVIDSIMLTIKNDKAVGEIFNIGSGNKTKIKDLARIIINISNKELNPIFENPRIGDIAKSYADISKAKNILEYEPKYSLERGLISIINGN